MITFFSSSVGVTGCQYYLKKRGKKLAQRMSPLCYQVLPELNGIPAGASIFAAIDQLSPLQREAATEIWNQLSQAGQHLLNHPTRSWRRYQLLRNLYETGRNRFQVFQANESSKVERFPVFVREADQHNGSLTPLLSTRAALEHALRGLMARGYRTASLLIVEYCDARDSCGLTRKYSAFKVGDVVLAKHLMFSTQWMVKHESTLEDEEVDEDLVQEAQEYIRSNPHEAWIREIFELAEIGYGRIDYGFSNGTPQVWEVNTDPTIGRPPIARRPGRERYRSIRKLGQDLFHKRFRAALCELDHGAAGAREIHVRLDAGLRQELKAERRRKVVSRAIHRYVEYLIGTPPIQRLKPLLNPLVTKIAPRLGQILRSMPQ